MPGSCEDALIAVSFSVCGEALQTHSSRHINLMHSIQLRVQKPVHTFNMQSSHSDGTAVQSQEAVSAYFTSNQIVPFGFAKRCRDPHPRHSEDVRREIRGTDRGFWIAFTIFWIRAYFMGAWHPTDGLHDHNLSESVGAATTGCGVIAGLTLGNGFSCRLNINPLTAKLFNPNFHSLEVVSRWRDPQLPVSENDSDLTKWRSTLFNYCWLMSHFIFDMFKRLIKSENRNICGSGG